MRDGSAGAFIVPSSQVSQAATSRDRVTWRRMGESIRRTFVSCEEYFSKEYRSLADAVLTSCIVMLGEFFGTSESAQALVSQHLMWQNLRFSDRHGGYREDMPEHIFGLSRDCDAL